MWPLPIENSLLHNTYHQIHMTQGAIFLFFKKLNVTFSLNLFSMTWNKRQNSMSSAGKFPPCPPSSYIFLFCFRFQKTYETNIGMI